jgi:uncharacterized membrane protein YqjE
MDLVSLLIVVCILSIVAWVFFTYVPVPQPFKTIIMAVLALIFCVWLLQSFGLGGFHVGRVR